MNGHRRRWGFGLLALGLAMAITALGVGTALATNARIGPMGGGQGMGGMMGDADLAMLRGLSGDAFDRAFIAQMVPHHEMAVMMAQMALPGAQHQELRALLTSIVASQSAEIAQMRQW